MGIRIITDSTSYLSSEQIGKYDIKVVSLNINWNNESFKETDMDNDDFYNRLASDKHDLPKSSQPNVEEFTSAFEDAVKEGHEAIGIFLSSEMSGTYQTAHMIKNQLEEEYDNARIHLIDSRSNCMQLGLLALTAAKMASEGKDVNTIVDACEDLKLRSKFIFMPGTLEYLRRGGRIGTAKALVGSLLKITPLLTVTQGITTIFAKVRTKKKALNYLIDYFEEQIDDLGHGDVIVHHIQNLEEGKALAKRIEDRIGRPVPLHSIGPVIGTHVGPGAIGIVYYTREKPVE